MVSYRKTDYESVAFDLSAMHALMILKIQGRLEKLSALTKIFLLMHVLFFHIFLKNNFECILKIYFLYTRVKLPNALRCLASFFCFSKSRFGTGMKMYQHVGVYFLRIFAKPFLVKYKSHHNFHKRHGLHLLHFQCLNSAIAKHHCIFNASALFRHLRRHPRCNKCNGASQENA